MNQQIARRNIDRVQLIVRVTQDDDAHVRKHISFVILCAAMSLGDPIEREPMTAISKPIAPGAQAEPIAAADSVWQRFKGYAAQSSPLPPKGATFERLLYGLAQPLLGLRMLRDDRALLKESLVPAMLLGGFCALVALLGADSLGDLPRKFYRTFVVLAPVPSILFANHYSRLAGSAHRSLQFGAC